MSLTNSKPQHHRSLQKIREQNPSSPNQMLNARSNTSMANTLDDGTDEYEVEEPPAQALNSKQTGHGQRHPEPATNKPPGFLKTVLGLFPGTTSDPPRTNLNRPPKRSSRSDAMEPSPHTSQGKTGMSMRERKPKGKATPVAEPMPKNDQPKNQAESRTKESELENQLRHLRNENQRLINNNEQVQHELQDRTRTLEAKIQETKSEKEILEADYDSFLRQKVQESNDYTESARWRPVDGKTVIDDLDRLKRDMKALAKRMSTNDVSVFQQLDKADHSALMNSLAEVSVLTENALPEGLTSSRSLALLLNALLANHVYKTLFKNPFFFLGNGLKENAPSSGLDSELREIYKRAKQANEEEAHIWRSQTLRLLLPPPKHNTTTQKEQKLHGWTDGLISNAANLQAANFLEGPAQYLIRKEFIKDSSSRVQSIYKTAAEISYMLWTRRTNVRCYLLKDLGHPLFDPEDKNLVPHSSVKYDLFEGQLKGKPITLIVHPLLRLYGTNDAKDYDQGLVWAPGEVWLDSSASSVM